MTRNRRNQSAAIRFGPAVKALLLCLLIGGSGVGYVWQKSQIGELGRQIVKREQELRLLQKQNEKLNKQLSVMNSVTFLEARIKQLNLGMVPPQPGQVWRLKEPAMDKTPSESATQYAQRKQPLGW